MASKKFSDLTALTSPDPADYLAILDVSDLTMGASGITKKITYQNLLGGAENIFTATATLDFGSISAQTGADLTITVTGAKVGDSVAIGLPAAPLAGVAFMGFVSAADTVTIRAMNYSSSSKDPASATYRATVINYS